MAQLLTVDDNEEKGRLLAQVQEDAQRVKEIMDTVPEGVLLLDAQARVVLANPVAEGHLAALSGARVGDVLTGLGGHPLPEFLTSPPTAGLWHEVTANDRTFEILSQPMGAGPEPERWVLLINDVSQERKVREQIQRQERLAVVGQLAAGIAHDFNNIMAVIILYAQMTAQSPGLSDRDRDRLATINQQACRATQLIQQILDFSRRAVIDRLPLDLLPLLKEQVRMLERTLPEHIKIDLVYGPGEYTVNADPTRLQQMITNLALNARDAMPEGGTLRIGLARIVVRPGEHPVLPDLERGEWITLTVSDSGTGMPPAVSQHIFEPFFTTKAPGEGTGLGLAQVHGIVGQHGGRIGMETTIGEGTTFTICLPPLPVQPPETSVADLSAMPKGRGQVVLVVEDGPAVRAALVEILKLLNYGVLEATNGKEALAILEQRRDQIALVLSDVVMPVMGGIALLHAMRQQEMATPVILLTGHSMSKELGELRAQGLNAWLPKPPSLDLLAQALADALSKKN